VDDLRAQQKKQFKMLQDILALLGSGPASGSPTGFQHAFAQSFSTMTHDVTMAIPVLSSGTAATASGISLSEVDGSRRGKRVASGGDALPGGGSGSVGGGGGGDGGGGVVYMTNLGGGGGAKRATGSGVRGAMDDDGGDGDVEGMPTAPPALLRGLTSMMNDGAAADGGGGGGSGGGGGGAGRGGAAGAPPAPPPAPPAVGMKRSRSEDDSGLVSGYPGRALAAVPVSMPPAPFPPFHPGMSMAPSIQMAALPYYRQVSTDGLGPGALIDGMLDSDDPPAYLDVVRGGGGGGMVGPGIGKRSRLEEADDMDGADGAGSAVSKRRT